MRQRDDQTRLHLVEFVEVLHAAEKSSIKNEEEGYEARNTEQEVTKCWRICQIAGEKAAARTQE